MDSFFFLLSAWWLTPAIPAFGRQKQDDHKYKASLGYLVRSCHKKSKAKPNAVAHRCNPNYAGGVGRMITAPGRPGKYMGAPA
jgi:hypothetical protein